MSKENYELLKDTMDEIVTVAVKYDKHLQPAVVDCLSSALIANSSGVSSERHACRTRDRSDKW